MKLRVQVMDCMKICFVPLIPGMLSMKVGDQCRTGSSDDAFIHVFTSLSAVRLVLPSTLRTPLKKTRFDSWQAGPNH